MKNTKFIVFISVLILVSALALVGCIYLISGTPEETKGYDPDEMSFPSVIEETPTAQSEMQKKFAAYGREETGDNGEKVFRLFTEEQIEESISLREKGERRSLSYDEILFIINDSIRMYFEYDKILVTDFSSHTHVKEAAHPLDFDMRLYQNRYRKCGIYSYEYVEMIPYHGDYSDCDSYKSALETYSRMISDIEYLIFERLRIHDTGTDSYCLVSPVNDSDDTRFFGILLDGGKLTDTEKYGTVLNNSIKQAKTGKKLVDPEDAYPMIIMTDKYYAESGKPSISIYYNEVDERKGTKLFPTEQLEALRPDGIVTFSGMFGDGREITIEFDRWNGHVVYTEKHTDSETVEEGRYSISKNLSVDAGYLSLSLDNERFQIKFDGDNIRIYHRNYIYDPIVGWIEKYDSIKIEVTSFYGETVSSMELFYEK